MPKGVYPRTATHRERLSQAGRGRPLSEEHRKRISEGQQGRVQTQETRDRISQSKRGLYNGGPTLDPQPSENRYIYLSMQYSHPLSDSGSVVLQHRLVLWDSLGCESLECEHDCYWCGKTLTWGGNRGIVADHLDGNKQNNHPENLVVSCNRCNIRRGNGE